MKENKWLDIEEFLRDFKSKRVMENNKIEILKSLL